MITCSQHGRSAGYIVCVHVMAGSPVAHRLESDDDAADDLGEVLCASCVTWFDTKVEDDDGDFTLLKLVCANCLRQLLGPERPH